MQPPTHTRICKKCSIKFTHHQQNKLLCNDCVKENKKANNRNYNKKTNTDPNLSVPEIINNAHNTALVSIDTAQAPSKNPPTELYPFSTERKKVDSDKAELDVFEVTSSKNSEALSNWDALLLTYGDHEGDAFEFKREHSNTGYIWYNTAKYRKIRLKEWNSWLQEEKKKPLEERDCLYITGITLLDSDIECLHKNDKISAFASCGLFDLTSYILRICRDAPIPQMDFIFLISPPWGNVMTYPHMDGYGSQLSTHCFLMGNGENLIHLWPKLDETQSHYFREILSLPKLTDAQQGPHSQKYYVDASVNNWDEKLEKKLNEYGIFSQSIKIKPGQAVLLPPSKYHCFKKITHQSDSDMPLVSCACDASFVGIENFVANYYTIKRCQEVHRITHSLFELGLLCLYKNCQSASLSGNPFLFNHAIAGLPIFIRWIEEQKQLLSVLQEVDVVDDVNEMKKELTCSRQQCLSPISNFFIKKGSKYYCLRCAKSTSKPQVHYRLFDIEGAEKIVQKIRSMISLDQTEQPYEEIETNVPQLLKDKRKHEGDEEWQNKRQKKDPDSTT